jgi:murein DD-endopeptidase MepM/ murein hydrolase activator NlpD
MLALAGCLQQRAAPIDDRGGSFFGRDAMYDMRGNEMPRYSNQNPADMPADQDAKYIHDNQQTYGLSAEVGSVSASDLPPVEASAPISDATLAAQQAADKAAADARLVSESLPTARNATGVAVSAIAPPVVSNITAVETTPAVAAPAFVWPLKGDIIKDFKATNQEGINIAGREGEPIRASSDGVVVYTGDKLQGYGTMVIIQHAKGYVTTYAHLSDAVVAKEDTVIGGQLIGFVGKSGNVTSPQLHFSLREGTKPLNPSGLLK